MSKLRKSLKKRWKKYNNPLVNVNKGCSFAPAIATGVLLNSDKQTNLS